MQSPQLGLPDTAIAQAGFCEGTHLPALHVREAQSPSLPQAAPVAQGRQLSPPQSTSVSSPFFT